MAHQHSPRFLKIVENAKKRIREVSVDDVKTKIDRAEKFVLVDVREESEWAKDHLPGAIHLGKGIIERDIEATAPDKSTELILYCGGGYRSSAAASLLARAGFTHLLNVAGGTTAWVRAGLPTE